MNSWAKRLAPIFVVQSFLWTTIALYAFGPWQWSMRSNDLYWFVGASHIAILIGYLSVAHRTPVSEAPGPSRKLIYAGLVATLAILPLTSYARTGRWIPDIMGGLLDPGRAYADAQVYTENGANFAAYLRVLVSPWLVMLLPLGVFFWSKLGWPVRIALIATMLATTLMSVATGQRRDIADLLVTLPFVAMASHWAGVTRWRRPAIIAASLATCGLIVAFTGYFVYSHVSRIGAEAASHSANPVTRQLPDIENPIIQALPDEIKPGALGLINYLATGYYGLSLAMDREVRPMYGMGHSMFLTRNFGKLTNDPHFEKRSLPVQISDKDGFRYPVLWCTAYPYFANDVGFLGTVLLLFFLGRAFALTWVDMLGGRNPYAVVLFSLIAVLLFYLPATNRMLQDGEGVMAFYSWLLIWGVSRLKRQATPTPILARS